MRNVYSFDEIIEEYISPNIFILHLDSDIPNVIMSNLKYFKNFC